jgi:Na+-driven multidrug efflux pump
MLCSGLGNAKGAILLATSRQGTCMIPLLYPLAYFFQAQGIVAVQAGADFLSLVLAVPIAIQMTKKIRQAQQTMELVQ